jgi:hypothetical protein
MSVPVSSFASHQILASGRLAPVGRTPAADLRTYRSGRDDDAVIHLSDAARAILAGTLPPSEVTVLPVRVPPDPPAAEDVQDAEFEPVFAPAEPELGAPWAAEPAEGDAGAADAAEGRAATSAFDKPRTPEQERAIQQLAARDAEVRAHEAAHAGAAGSLGGRPSLEYVVGPDGKRYAVGGEVSVDTSPGRTPEETIARARTIRAAATAPASPSAQDLAVAAAATRMESEAQAAIRERHQSESRGRLERISAEAVDQQAVRRIDWSRVGETKGTATAANDVKGEGAAPAQAAAVAAATASLPAPDPEMVMLQLVREQVSARGGMGHTHLSSGCGFCRRAAATYSYA